MADGDVGTEAGARGSCAGRRPPVPRRHYRDGTSTFRDAITGSAALRAYTLATMGAALDQAAEDADDAASAYMTGASNAVGIVPVYGGALTFLVDAALDAGGPNSLRSGWTDNAEDQVKANQDLQWNARQDLRVQVALALQRAGVISTGFSAAQIASDPSALEAWLDGGNLPDDVSSVVNDLDASFKDGADAGGKG